MSIKEIHFMSLLANTDSSILKVNLSHGFKIEKMESNKIFDFFSSFSSEMTPKKLVVDYRCLNSPQDEVYFVSNTFEGDVEIDDKGILETPNCIFEFDNNFVRPYLISKVRLMRLFKEGNICIPWRGYYFLDDSTPKILGSFSQRFVVPSLKYSLKNSEISDLQEFIRNTELPFEKSFLQLAFEIFEVSYEIYNNALSFLSLMISLESLFNPGGGELGYRISRNTAVLLGKGKKDSKKIQSEIKILYGKRSGLVHTGEGKIEEKELLNLRDYVRKSIKKIYKMNKNKDELLDMLNSSGFDERLWGNE